VKRLGRYEALLAELHGPNPPAFDFLADEPQAHIEPLRNLI
jgi:hypothetical protein